MRMQERYWRGLLGALVVVMAASSALGSGDGARAADDVRKRPDYGSKQAFQLECELLGGTFSEDGIGNTHCRFPDGGWIECDANGNDCYYDPPDEPAGSPTGPRLPRGPGTTMTDEPEVFLDSSAPEPRPTVVAATDDDLERDPDDRQRKSKKKGKHDKKGGKRRK